MLIRSKNKMHIVNIRSGVVSAGGNGTIEFRKGKIRIVLGEYSSLKKAIKVLDMIQETYVKYETERIYKEGVFEIGAFQMPEDSEVEA